MTLSYAMMHLLFAFKNVFQLGRSSTTLFKLYYDVIVDSYKSTAQIVAKTCHMSYVFTNYTDVECNLRIYLYLLVHVLFLKAE